LLRLTPEGQRVEARASEYERKVLRAHLAVSASRRCRVDER